MRYYIGIDGGATKTRCVLCNDELTKLIEYSAPATSLTTNSVENVASSLFDLINRASKKTDEEVTELNIGIGLAGGGRQNEILQLKTTLTGLLKTRRVNYDYLEITSDARIALEAAHAGNPGGILIAGTGSILFWKDSKKKINRIGGYGRIIGDEGSGYAIGLDAIKQLASFFDKMIEENELIKSIRELIQCNDTNSLIQKIYRENFEISRLAEVVFEKAIAGEKNALEIINKNALQLVEIIKHFVYTNNENLPVSFTGGLFEHSSLYKEVISNLLNSEKVNIEIKEMQYSNEMGAVILVKN